MREHKYKAWLPKEKRMLASEDICALLLEEGKPYALVVGMDTFTEDEFILLDFIGRKGKDDVEIYEGDIVKTPEGYSGDYRQKEQLQVVSWETADGSQDIGFWISLPDGAGWSNCEVIGNIYENPELMEL